MTTKPTQSDIIECPCGQKRSKVIPDENLKFFDTIFEMSEYKTQMKTYCVYCLDGMDSFARFHKNFSGFLCQFSLGFFGFILADLNDREPFRTAALSNTNPTFKIVVQNFLSKANMVTLENLTILCNEDLLKRPMYLNPDLAKNLNAHGLKISRTNNGFLRFDKLHSEYVHIQNQDILQPPLEIVSVGSESITNIITAACIISKETQSSIVIIKKPPTEK